MKLKQALKITLLIVILAEEIKSVRKPKIYIRNKEDFELKKSDFGLSIVDCQR